MKFKDLLYEKKNNKYYIFILKLNGSDDENDNYLLINIDINNKKRIEEIFNIINYSSVRELKQNKDKHSVKDFISNVINSQDMPYQNEVIIVNKLDNKNFSIYKKIKMYYLNYMNKKYCFDIIININWKLKSFVNLIAKLYHIPHTKAPKKSIINLFLKNKFYEGKDIANSKEKVFVPSSFNYEKDYILVLEKENFDSERIMFGYKNIKNNFKGEKIPHIVLCLYNNYFIETLMLSKELNFLECEIYTFNNEVIYNLNRKIGEYKLKTRKDAYLSLLLSDWKNKCNYVTSLKGIIYSFNKYDKVAYFSISPKITLCHNKAYVFLITSPNLNINAFEPKYEDNGLSVFSLNDKAILKGFIGKKISDLSL